MLQTRYTVGGTRSAFSQGCVANTNAFLLGILLCILVRFHGLLLTCGRLFDAISAFIRLETKRLYITTFEACREQAKKVGDLAFEVCNLGCTLFPYLNAFWRMEHCFATIEHEGQGQMYERTIG